MNDKYKINDTRDLASFKTETFSGFKKTDVIKKLFKCIETDKIEEACYWVTECIVSGYSQELFEKVIQHIRNNEHITDFPKPFEMDRIGKKMNYEVRQGRPEYTGCEYCDDTGFIMRDGYNYNCKCPTGSVRNKGVSYFDKY